MLHNSRIRHVVGASVVLLLVALVVGAPGASAGRTWCKTDPVIKVDGQVADVFISSYSDMNLAATGPVKIVVTIPTGSTGTVLALDNGFGKGYQVSFVTSSSLQRTPTHTQVKVAVTAPATDSTLPVQVDFTPRSMNPNIGPLLAASATGTANKSVTLTTK